MSVQRCLFVTSGGWYHVKLLPSRRTFCVLSLRVHVRLAVTCPLSVLLAVCPGVFTCYNGTRGWYGWRNKNQHRKLTPEKKIISPLLRPEIEPATFLLQVPHSSIELSSLSKYRHSSSATVLPPLFISSGGGGGGGRSSNRQPFWLFC